MTKKNSTKRTLILVANKAWNIYNFRLNLARALKKEGYQVILIAPDDEFRPLLEQEFPFNPIKMNSQGTNPLQDIQTLIEFYRLYRKIQPDAVFHFTIKPNIYGNLAVKLTCLFKKKNPTINNITGLGTLFVKETWATQVVKWLYKLALSNSEKVFFQNQDDQKYFIKNHLVLSNQSSVLPGSGVNPEKFSPRKKPKTKEFTFLVIARMLWDKGIGEYVEAAQLIKKKYPQTKFLLLGPHDGDSPSSIPPSTIEAWQQKGIITYLGNKDDVRDEIAGSDVVVLPSYREGTPRVLLEASSMEKPILTTDVPGCRDLIDDGVNGFRCKNRNVQDLSAKMEKFILLKPKQFQKMGKQGRKIILQKYDEKIVIEQYLQALNSFWS